MEKTFVLIKPNTMKKGKAGAVIDRFQKEGLEVKALKMIHLSSEKCEEFYQEHRGETFFFQSW